MIFHIAIGALVSLLGCAYVALKPPRPKICGSPGGPPVTSPRVRLDDGRHLAYKERGTSKEEAKHKIIVSHGFDDSKDFHLPISEELLKELWVYLLSFDRAGYGESDPNPSRSVKSEAFDIQELADKLQFGPKFFVIGISMGAYSAYGCLKCIPHRLSGVALVVPMVNYWWHCFPAKLSKDALSKLPLKLRWIFRVAYNAPWLLHWWMTQEWFPSLNVMEVNLDMFSRHDLETLKQLSGTPEGYVEKVRQQGVYECLTRDMVVGSGKWDFDPTHITNPFPSSEGAVHLWQGYEDKVIPRQLNQYLSEKLPWIQYHEIRDAGHLLIYNSSFCEAIFKKLVTS